MTVRRGFARLKRQEGFSLLETLIAVALVGVIAVAFLQALRTGSKSSGVHEERVVALGLAQSQLEEIKAMPYDALGNYAVAITSPTGYNVSVSTVQQDVDKQEVTVAVSHNGTGVFKLAIVKTNR